MSKQKKYKVKIIYEQDIYADTRELAILEAQSNKPNSGTLKEIQCRIIPK